MIPKLTDHTFDQIIENASAPVLVEFWSPDCRNCRALLYELDRLSEGKGREIAIYKMDINENAQIPAEYRISDLPALALFSKGKFLRFIGGAGKKQEIRLAIEKALSGEPISLDLSA
jgi:thioredoxin 1